MTKTQKRQLESMDVVQEKREQFKKLFPEIFSESKIDYDLLKRIMGDEVGSGAGAGERFGLSWPGKSKCLKIIQQPSIATLRPSRKESVDFDNTENIFIEGENLEALKLLQKSYFGKIKIIYIDPPYNIGNESVYQDNYEDPMATYLAYTGQVDDEGRKFSTNTDTVGRYHSNWLNMMYPRLYLARNLLKEDGVIFISIDNKEYTNLKVLCDIVFGEENFIESIIWRKKSGGGQQDDYIITEHDYIICYAKNKEGFFFVERKPSPKTKGYNNFDEKKNKNYKKVKLAKWGSAALKEDRPTMYDYPELIDPDGKQCFPVSPDGRPGRWRYGRQRILEMIQNDDIEWEKKDGEWIPYEKDYEPEEGGILKERSILYDLVENTSGANELKQLFGIKDVFPNPKPSELLAHLLYLVSKPNDKDIILDFFAGSCSTGHSVMVLNNIDNGNRRFINVQIPEGLDSTKKEHRTALSLGYKTIADIGKDRIRKAARSICQEQKKKPRTKFKQKIDFGFKVFKLSKSNFKAWKGNVEEISNLEEQLFDHIDHIKKDRTQEDILYELLLKSGFSLTTRVKKTRLASKDVFSIEDGEMLICLEKNLTEGVIEAMANSKPRRVICLDEGFRNNDQLKANAVQLFKSCVQKEEREVVFSTV